jgi:hypothetical protein
MKLLRGGCRYLKLFPGPYEINSVKIAGLFHLQTKIYSLPFIQLRFSLTSAALLLNIPVTPGSKKHV